MSVPDLTFDLGISQTSEEVLHNFIQHTHTSAMPDCYERCSIRTVQTKRLGYMNKTTSDWKTYMDYSIYYHHRQLRNHIPSNLNPEGMIQQSTHQLMSDVTSLGSIWYEHVLWKEQKCPILLFDTNPSNTAAAFHKLSSWCSWRLWEPVWCIPGIMKSVTTAESRLSECRAARLDMNYVTARGNSWSLFKWVFSSK
jgi:hypothetical protein